MAKTISVHVNQVIDGKVSINSDHTYYSEEEFEKARQEAINNWKDMQGGAAEIECFGEMGWMPKAQLGCGCQAELLLI